MPGVVYLVDKLHMSSILCFSYSFCALYVRADHSLQDVRSKLFPFKWKKIKAEEVPSPDSLPTKRKERSISSLVVNTPKVKPTSLTGRRTRAVARKAAAALRGIGPVMEDPVKKEIDSCDSQSQSGIFPANSGKARQTRRQVNKTQPCTLYIAYHLHHHDSNNRHSCRIINFHLEFQKGTFARRIHIPTVTGITGSFSLQISSNAESSNKDVEDDEELPDKGELWQPLNCLVEAANRTKSCRSSSQNPVVKGEQINGSPSSIYTNRTKTREHLQKPKTDDNKKEVPMPPVMLKRRVGTGRRRRQLQAPADAKPDAAVTQNEKKLSSIWFSLVAFDQ
jgi:E3 ubiquitin-protein ligase DRIP